MAEALTGLPIPAIPILAVVTFGASEAIAQYPGELQGVVRDAVTGEPVAGARVVLVTAGREALSTGDGSVRFRGVDPGTVELASHRIGYRGSSSTLEVRNGEVTRFVLDLVPQPVSTPAIAVAAERTDRRILRDAEIRSLGAGSVGDLLRRIPGVTIVGSGAGGEEEVRMRGGGADQVLVLVDGVPLNDPVTGTADLSTVRAGEVRRIEVFPGARTARFGAGALAGVVSIETEGARRSVEGAVGLGSLGERSGEVSAGTRVRGVGVGGGVSSRRLEGEFAYPRDMSLGGGAARRRNADVAEQRASLALEGERGPHRWNFRARADALERGIPGKSFAPSDSARQRTSSITAVSSWMRTAESGNLTLHVHHRRRDLRFRDPDPPLGVAFDTRTRLVDSGGTLRAETQPAPWASLGSSIEVDHRRLSGSTLGREGPSPVWDAAVALHFDGSFRSGLLGLSAAARAHRDGRAGGWLGAHELTLRTGHGPIGGYLTHRSSFSPPSAGDLFFREGVGIEPNPDLRPERVPSEWEVGLSSRFHEKGVSLEVAGEVFAGDLHDMIVWIPDFRFTWSPRNVDVRRRGLELRLDLGHDASGLSAAGHLSRVAATYQGEGGTPGVQVVYRPRDSAGMELGWEGRVAHARLAGRYVGRRFPVRAAANALDPFWTWELVVGTERPLAGWVVTPLVRVERLLDERAPFIHAVPEPGRTFAVEIRARLGA